jgi:hypothetical protein
MKRTKTWSRFALTLCFLIIAAFSSGCATNYVGDRGRDASDIFTLTVGTGAGAKARVGPFQAGILDQRDKFGLRGGTVGSFERPVGETYNRDIQFIVAGNERFDARPEVIGDREKDFRSKTIALVSAPSRHNAAYYGQVEIVLAPMVSIRAGFNFVELVDFLAGFMGIDLLGDDIDNKEKVEENLPL